MSHMLAIPAQQQSAQNVPAQLQQANAPISELSVATGVDARQYQNIVGVGRTTYGQNPTEVSDRIPRTFRTQGENLLPLGGVDLVQRTIKFIIQHLVKPEDHPILGKIFELMQGAYGTTVAVELFEFHAGTAAPQPDLGISALLADSRSRTHFTVDRQSIGSFQPMWYGMTQEAQEMFQFKLAQLRDAFVRQLVIRCYRCLLAHRNPNEAFVNHGLYAPPTNDKEMLAVLHSMAIANANSFVIASKDSDKAYAQIAQFAERALGARNKTFTTILATPEFTAQGVAIPQSTDAATLGPPRAARGYAGVGPVTDIPQPHLLMKPVQTGASASSFYYPGRAHKTFGSHVLVGNLTRIASIHPAKYTRSLQWAQGYDFDRGVYVNLPSFDRIMEHSGLFEGTDAGSELKGPIGAKFFGANLALANLASASSTHPRMYARRGLANGEFGVTTFGEYMDVVGMSNVIARYFDVRDGRIGGGQNGHVWGDVGAAKTLHSMLRGRAEGAWGALRDIPIKKLKYGHLRGLYELDIPVPIAFALARFTVRCTTALVVALDLTRHVGIAVASPITSTSTIEHRQATNAQMVGYSGAAVVLGDAILRIPDAVGISYDRGGSFTMYDQALTPKHELSAQMASRTRSHAVEIGTPDAVVIPLYPDEAETIAAERILAMSWPSVAPPRGGNLVINYIPTVPLIAGAIREAFGDGIPKVLSASSRGPVDALNFSLISWQGAQFVPDISDSGALVWSAPQCRIPDLAFGYMIPDQIRAIFGGGGSAMVRV